ncbi:MAG: AI-2E family transporter [Merdibacter sp.]
MCITFVELCIGLSVLGVDNSITISFLIALFDVLPVFGTGGIMIPWIIISLLMQDIKLAVGLTIVYLIITLIRNIIEPRIVGEQIGLRPLLMLLSMYLGIRFFGFLGLFLLPATLLQIKELNEKGILHIYKTEKEGPPAKTILNSSPSFWEQAFSEVFFCLCPSCRNTQRRKTARRR